MAANLTNSDFLCYKKFVDFGSNKKTMQVSLSFSSYLVLFVVGCGLVELVEVGG